MVQGINQKNYIDSYNRNQKKTLKSSEDAPPFLLNYDEEGVVWEHGDAEKGRKETSEAENRKNSANSIGGNASVSNNTKKRDSYESSIFPEEAVKRTKIEEAGTAEVIIRRISLFLKNTVIKLKQFFWYGSDEKVKEHSNQVSDAKTSNTLTREERINELLRKKDKAGLVDELTEHNTRVLAKNTELLTQYNRFGKVVEVNGSMKRQILEGDKAMKM
ncbi:MAG: hypothetical protein ACI4DU_06335 [Lachnospiraceae bacterium]